MRHNGRFGCRGASRGLKGLVRKGNATWSCIRRTQVSSSSTSSPVPETSRACIRPCRNGFHALMEDSGGKVGWGQGVRTAQQQLQLFLERHSPDPQGTIVWNGQTYSRHPGVAAAVPPGRSMHEVGLAADMAGDFAWLGNNVGRFGLMTFAEVNHEPWHVQPVELPKGRQQYEQQGSKWGAYPSYNRGFQEARSSCSNPGRHSDDRIGRVEPSRCADPHPGAGRPTRRRRPGGTRADGGAGRSQCASGRSREPRRQLRHRRQGVRAAVPARKRSGRRRRGRSSDVVEAALDGEPWRTRARW